MANGNTTPTYSEFPNSNIVDAKIREALTSKADKETTYTKTEVDTKIVGFVDGAEYDSTTKKIILKHGTTTVADVDATSFIKDGMVSSVVISGGNLVITFNSDAGQQPISIPLTRIFNPSNYYDKSAADDRFVQKETGKSLFSGNYNDLSNKPTIPDEQVQSDWNESDSTKKSFIKNKPTIPTVPTNVSAFTNDAGYLTQENLDYVMRIDPETGGIYYTTPDTNA